MTSFIADMERQLSPSEFQNEPLVQKCSVLQDKLNSLLANLKEEAKNGSTSFTSDSSPPSHVPLSEASDSVEGGGSSGGDGDAVKSFKQREALMTRANSLKKAMQSVLDATEKVLDMQAEATEEIKVLSEGRVEEEGRGSERRRDSPPASNGDDRQTMTLRLPKDSISSVVDLAPYVDSKLHTLSLYLLLLSLSVDFCQI